jgi:hypothetical protein
MIEFAELVCSPGAVNGYQSRTRDEEDEEALRMLRYPGTDVNL